MDIQALKVAHEKVRTSPSDVLAKTAFDQLIDIIVKELCAARWEEFVYVRPRDNCSMVRGWTVRNVTGGLFGNLYELESVVVAAVFASFVSEGYLIAPSPASTW
mgnify:CR=1 FL=1